MIKERKKRIVLVEDEPTLANLIELHLKKEGFEVWVAGDGKKGLGMILKEKPDLVLLDIMLPGMSGFDILEELDAKGILPGLPVIIVSASGQPVEIERALKFGVRDYLIKVNFNPDEVLAKVHRVMGAENPPKAQTTKEETAQKNTPPAAKARSQKPGKNNNVLLVEDDALLVDALERKFAQNNYEVFKAINAQQARSVLEKEAIDVVLLDIVLPDTNGLDFLKELKESKEWSSIPVIIISNLGQRDEIKEGMRAGAVDYLVKAETVPDEIFQKVHAIRTKG